jgi:hypothetical protein
VSILRIRHGRVFTDPVDAGDRVTFTATASAESGRVRSRRAVARIEADEHGVRVHPMVDGLAIGGAVVAAALVAWAARRRAR